MNNQYPTSDKAIRMWCLELASQTCQSTDRVVKDAELIYDFISPKSKGVDKVFPNQDDSITFESMYGQDAQRKGNLVLDLLKLLAESQSKH